MTSGRLIVLSGEAGAGKDSVADILVADHSFEKFSLSEEMKLFCQRVFSWSDDQLWGPSHFRNAPDPKWARSCPRLNGMCKKCDDCDGGVINDNSPRRVLQLLGDEWARQMIHPDIWTMSARPGLEARLSAGARIVINDARFANDRDNLAAWLGAKRVDVRAPNRRSDGASWRMHASERSRPTDDQVEAIIVNPESWPFPGLGERVATTVTELFP